MKRLLSKDLFWYFVYLIVTLIGIWFLTKYWIPDGYAVAGHDSGLALNAGGFLKTRFFAWDDRIDFGVDNSPHFGSVVLHSIDYALSLIARVPFAGNQIAFFFWIGALFLFGAIFSYSLKDVFGKYFAYLFPIFLTFNFYIFQSLFILERAKYELICVILLFLTFCLNILFNKKKSIFRSAMIFSLVFSIFNGGSWLGAPLYGGLLIAGFSVLIFATALSFKEKNFIYLKKVLLFSLLCLLFFILLNLYSLLPFISTLLSSDYAKVVSQGTINAGQEWLDYISRGSSWLNLFRLQGVPEWYLTGGLPNPDYSYAGIYLTNTFLVLVSFLFPVITFASALFSKGKVEKYLISFFVFLLLFSMFFISGTNSPLGFIYNFLYNKIPGFSIFRSPYYKFGSAFIISFAALMAFSLSWIVTTLSSKISYLLHYETKAFVLISELVLFVGIVGMWISYHSLAFDKQNIFKWQPDKSTLLKIPDYVYQFNNWLGTANLNGRILMVPAFDGASGNDSYNWGYWSLSPLPSIVFNNKDFVVNDTNIDQYESGWVDKLYSLLLQKDFTAFSRYSKRLGIGYLFVRNDFTSENPNQQKLYLSAVSSLVNNGDLKSVKSVGPWTVYSIKGFTGEDLFRLADNIFSVPSDHMFLAKEITASDYENGYWVDLKNTDKNLENITSKEFYPLSCDSCQIENLGVHADFPPVQILPNSLFYPIKKKLNERALDDAHDDNSKLGAYLGLIMIKLSEIRSMYDLRIGKQFILNGLNDMNKYLTEAEALISNSPSLKSNFYFVSKIYETLNSLERYFRDYVGNSAFGLEKPLIKDEIYKALWNGVSIKKLFGTVIADSDRWNYEKFFGLALPGAGQYSILIDSQTLPRNLKGGYILPHKMNLGNGGENFGIKNVLDNRWAFVENVSLPEEGGLHLYFQNLPDLFLKEDLKRLDFPEGTRGCLVGRINFFNKNRSYKLKIFSASGFGNLRLYIKENSNQMYQNGFLRGDIEMDVASGPNNGVFTYVYSPIQSAANPQIYLCRYDDNLPVGAQISALELFLPSVYVVKTNNVVNTAASLNYKKIDPTRYDLNVDGVNNDMVLVFNQTFNSLWKLYNNDGGDVLDHFVVDGYSNGWILPAGKSYKLSLVYRPQILFEAGRKISIVVAFLLLVIFLRLYR